ncbi:MAG: serine hydrolase [Candidatus Obscuribacterales bacterium]|nr:serine hydrolase [Candidatus Obscuribacterales bacterium]
MKIKNLFCFFLMLGSLQMQAAFSEDQSAPELKAEVAQQTITSANLKQALAELRTLAQKQIEENALPGLAISVVHNNKVVFAEGFGFREAGKKERVDANTVFQLASVSKSLASSVVASLVADGKINWDSKIVDLDPAFQMYDSWVSRQLTIRDLFCHRSGLPDHAGDFLEDLGYEQAEILYRLRFQKPDSSMRSHYAYTNFGLTEAALAAAKAYNLKWEDASAERIYKPLFMNSTSSKFSDYIARDNKALGHIRENGNWVHKFKRQPDAQSPAGGASSSVSDMAKWMIMEIASGKFEGKEIVKAAALKETHEAQIVSGFNHLNGKAEFYGLGFNVSYDKGGRLILGHSGAFSLGAATTIKMIPEEELGICILSNAYPTGIAEGLSQTFVELALSGKSSRDWLSLFKKVFADPATLGMEKSYDYRKAPAKPLAALSNSAYLGTYKNDLYGDLIIAEENKALCVKLGPLQKTYLLKHYDRDSFYYETESENSNGPNGLIFSIGADGKANSVLAETLDNFGQGRFEAVKD